MGLVFFVSVFRAIVEMLMLCMLARGVLYLVAGQGRGGNPIYRLFATVTGPLLGAFAEVLPSRLPRARVPLLAFFVLFLVWLGLAIVKKSI